LRAAGLFREETLATRIDARSKTSPTDRPSVALQIDASGGSWCRRDVRLGGVPTPSRTARHTPGVAILYTYTSIDRLDEFSP
jgi:hypothetical protein